MQEKLDTPKRKYNQLIKKNDTKLTKLEEHDCKYLPICKYLARPIIRSIAVTATSPLGLAANLLAGISRPGSVIKCLKEAVLGGSIQKTLITIAPQTLGAIFGLSLITSSPVSWPVIVTVGAIGIVALAYDAYKTGSETLKEGYSFEYTMDVVKDNISENLANVVSAFSVGMFWAATGAFAPFVGKPLQILTNEMSGGNGSLICEFDEQKKQLKKEISVSNTNINQAGAGIIDGKVKGFGKGQTKGAIAENSMKEKINKSIGKEVDFIKDKFSFAKEMNDEDYVKGMRAANRLGQET